MVFKNQTENLRKYLKEKEVNNEFSGVVHIKHKEEVLFSDSFGYANRTWKIKNNLNTKYRIGSVSKLFTAVAVVKLFEENKVNLEDKIHDYLDLKDSFIPEDVTIYHLLTHTSGIGDYYDEMNSTDDDWYDLWKKRPIYTVKELSDYYEMFKGEKSHSKAGEKFHYCGAGYILLGMLIEKITGNKYDKHIEETIFKKLKMDNTSYIDNEEVIDEVADGYEPVFDDDDDEKVVGWKKNIFTMTPLPASDGGATSTAEDIIKFSRALRNNELLSEENKKLILEPQVIDQNSDGSHGYEWKYSFANWFILKDDKVVRYGHTGEEFGVSARLYYYPEEDIDIAILGNQGFCAGSVGWEINELIVNEQR